MKIVEVYRSADGSLHDDKMRAAANDLHHALPKSSVSPNSKVLDWTDCVRILECRKIIQKVFDDLDSQPDIEARAGRKHDPNE